MRPPHNALGRFNGDDHFGFCPFTLNIRQRQDYTPHEVIRGTGVRAPKNFPIGTGLGQAVKWKLIFTSDIFIAKLV